MKSKLITVLALAITGTLTAQSNAPTAPAVGASYTIDQCVNTFDAAKSKKTKAGSEYWFADRDFADLTTVKLSAIGVGLASHAPHRHVEDEFFFIVEGKAEFYLDGERRMVGPMTSLYAPSNREHGIRNAGDTELKYLVLKKYPTKK